MNKIKFILLILTFYTTTSFAQYSSTYNMPKYDLKPYHFGFLLAYNQFDFSIKPMTNLSPFDSLMVVESLPQSGFGLGVVSDLRLGKYFNLRFTPTISFGGRFLNYSIKYRDTIIQEVKKEIESTYLDFPLILKLKSSRMENFRIYVLGGAQYSVDLASQAKKTTSNKNDIIVKIKRDDLSIQGGIGLEFYFESFKFATELKMSYGMKDMIDRENNLFSNSIDKLNSKIMQISFLFE